MKLSLVSPTPNSTAQISEQITRSTSSSFVTGIAAAKRAVQSDRVHPLSDQQRSLDDRGSGPWSTQHLPYTICGTLLVAVALVAVLAYVIIKRRRKAASSPSATPEPPKQQTLIKDSPKFTVHLTSQHQIGHPNGNTLVGQESDTQIMPPISVGMMTNAYPNSCAIGAKIAPIDLPINCSANVQPIRMKSRLLERRGSNVSLTIDVHPIIVESLQMATPPKECSAIEYLSSAGNRMTRKQLRICLKDTKSMHQEFLDIPLNHPKKYDMPGCSNKNRYKSIWPNENTRVLLPQRNRTTQCVDDQMNSDAVVAPSACEPMDSDQRVPSNGSAAETNEDESSTYINANYIRGLDSDTKAYIAAQGPLPNTVNDFWTMIWNERCPCIVMMTRLKENNRVKCESYLPNPQAQYSRIQVTVKSTTFKNGYAIRDLELECDTEIRQLKHFWFTGWPDHKAPTSTAKQLIDLVQDVEFERQRQSAGQIETNLIGPVLVHCSAGLGRTGCFIATSMGMKQLHNENMVDILGIVCQLRLDRGGMIQTVEQYEFIHHALIQYEKQLPESPASIQPPPTPLSSNGLNSNGRNGSRQELPVF